MAWRKIVNHCRCGIGLDALLLPTVLDEVFLQGVKQPLLFINSFGFLAKETVQLMKKLEKDPDETTKFSSCQILTIKYVCLSYCGVPTSLNRICPYIMLFLIGEPLTKAWVTFSLLCQISLFLVASHLLMPKLLIRWLWDCAMLFWRDFC